MEPPSSVVGDQKMTAGSQSNDPLPKFLATDSYIVVTGYPDSDSDGIYVVSGYSPSSRLTYFGTAGEIKS